MAILSAIIGVALSSAASAGLAYASQPDVVDPAKSSRKTVLASLRALPGQRQVEAASRLGTKVDYSANNWLTPRQAFKQGWIDHDTYQKLREKENAMDSSGFLEGGPFGGGAGINVLSDLIAPGSSMGYLAETPLRAENGKIRINVGKRRADFTGYGDADVQGKLAREMAGVTLDLQKKYGEDFATEAAREAELADPEGTAARELLAQKIMTMEAQRHDRQRPVAGALDESVRADLSRGSGVDDDVKRILEETLARRGDTSLAGGDVATELEGGLSGEQRLQQRLQKGLGYLSSGVSPEDAAYREEQQSMANMSSFLGGRTPQSQFASLSAGQQGASPGVRSGALPNVDPNLMQNAATAGAGGYSAGVRSAASQVSPWFVGLSTLLNGASVAGKAGYKPLAA